MGIKAHIDSKACFSTGCQENLYDGAFFWETLSPFAPKICFQFGFFGHSYSLRSGRQTLVCWLFAVPLHHRHLSELMNHESLWSKGTFFFCRSFCQCALSLLSFHSVFQIYYCETLKSWSLQDSTEKVHFLALLDQKQADLLFSGACVELKCFVCCHLNKCS